jgi:predicted nucleic acid-binding protein
MAKTGKKIYYWDTATFLAWLDGGKGHPIEVISGLDEVAKEVNENRAVLCTSVITNTEVLEGKLTSEQIARLQNVFKRRNVVQISVDARISQRASAIRNYYNNRGVKLSTPDSIHLATAIIYQADEFHTLDGDGKRQRTNDLLRLNGDVAGYPLHIRVPVAIQPSLLAGVASLPPEERNARQASQPSPLGVERSDRRHIEGKASADETKVSDGGRAIKKGEEPQGGSLKVN